MSTFLSIVRGVYGNFQRGSYSLVIPPSESNKVSEKKLNLELKRDLQNTVYQNVQLCFENFKWRNLFNFLFLVFHLNIGLRDSLQKFGFLELVVVYFFHNVEAYLSLKKKAELTKMLLYLFL